MNFTNADKRMSTAGPFWVVVADASRAVIYSRERRRSPLVQSLVVENEASRKKAGELLADKGGRSFDSHGEGRHTMAKEETGPKRQAALAFAKEIAGFISQATQVGNCKEFGVIAAPKFLGLLRTEMSSGHSVMPSFEIDKNVVTHDAADISDLIERSQ